MIDRDRLDELEADFGAEELSGILAAFLQEAQDAITVLGARGSEPDVKTDRLHFLKGCARMIGAVRLGDHCERLEAQAVFRPEDHTRLEHELRAVRDALNTEYLQQAG